MQLARFALVGVGGTLLYAVIALSLKAWGLPVFACHAVASAISLVVSYFGQKIFTFGIAGDHARRGARFFVATAILVVLQSSLVIALGQLDVSSNLTLIASTLFYPPASYLMHTFWTFRKDGVLADEPPTSQDT